MEGLVNIISSDLVNVKESYLHEESTPTDGINP